MNYLKPYMKGLVVFISFLGLSLFSNAQQLRVNNTRFIGGNNGDGIKGAIATRDKGILFFGGSYSRNSGDIGTNTDTINGNVLVGKMDSNGNLSWIKTYGGSGSDIGWAACQTKDGGYGVLCLSSSNDGDVTNHMGPPGPASIGIWLIKLDGSGNLVWGNSYGTSNGGTDPIHIVATKDNGFLFFGATNGSDSDANIHYGSVFSLDWLLVKVDSTGHRQWKKIVGGIQDESEAGRLLLAPDGGYYLISATASRDHNCITDTSWHPGAITGQDIYLFKFDSSGNQLWNKTYGGAKCRNIL